MRKTKTKAAPAIAVGLSHEARARTRAATVSLPDKGGQGVLVPDGYILTAAHCIDWSGGGEMALGDTYLASVKPRKGAAFRANVHAVDPVADIAVLGKPDSQTFYDDADAFETFCDATLPVPIRTDDLELEISVPVHVLSHKGIWIRATATRYGIPGTLPGASVVVEARSDITGGTSGGPVVDDAGRLIGIVSNSGGTGGLSREGTMPRPHLALPVWVWREIEAAKSARTDEELA